MTLLFDAYAARHLSSRGALSRPTRCASPAARGSTTWCARRARLSPDDIGARARRRRAPAARDALVLVTTKWKEAQRRAAGAPAGGRRAARRARRHQDAPGRNAGRVRAAAARAAARPRAAGGAPLAPLLAASRAVVTVNSTVALDAAVLGVPALVVGLPNNLSPFVEAGVMAGRATATIAAGRSGGFCMMRSSGSSSSAPGRRSWPASRSRVGRPSGRARRRGRPASWSTTGAAQARCDDVADEESSRSMRVLITGGAGFVGSHLAEALLDRGDEVFVLDNLSTGSIDNIAHLKPQPAASTTRSTRSPTSRCSPSSSTGATRSSTSRPRSA